MIDVCACVCVCVCVQNCRQRLITGAEHNWRYYITGLQSDSPCRDIDPDVAVLAHGYVDSRNAQQVVVACLTTGPCQGSKFSRNSKFQLYLFILQRRCFCACVPRACLCCEVGSACAWSAGMTLLSLIRMHTSLCGMMSITKEGSVAGITAHADSMSHCTLSRHNTLPANSSTPLQPLCLCVSDGASVLLEGPFLSDHRLLVNALAYQRADDSLGPSA